MLGRKQRRFQLPYHQSHRPSPTLLLTSPGDGNDISLSVHHPTTHQRVHLPPTFPSPANQPSPAPPAQPSPPSSSPTQPNPHPHQRTQRRKRGKSLAMAIPTMKRNNSSSNCSLRSYSSAGEVRATCYAASMTCSAPVHGFHYSTTGANGVDWRA
jgi:hypothetical protein